MGFTKIAIILFVFYGLIYRFRSFCFTSSNGLGKIGFPACGLCVAGGFNPHGAKPPDRIGYVLASDGQNPPHYVSIHPNAFRLYIITVILNIIQTRYC